MYDPTNHKCLISVFNAAIWSHAKANLNFQSIGSSFFLTTPFCLWESLQQDRKYTHRSLGTHFTYCMLTQLPTKQIWDFCNMSVFWEVNVVSAGKSCQALGLLMSNWTLTFSNLTVRTIPPYWHPIPVLCLSLCVLILVIAFNNLFADICEVFGQEFGPSLEFYQHKHRVNSDIHLCPEWDTKTRSQFSERRKTQHALDRASTYWLLFVLTAQSS